MAEHYERLDIRLEQTGYGDWRAEADTMDRLGVNITNYNEDKEEAVEWLRRGLEGLRITATSFAVFELTED